MSDPTGMVDQARKVEEWARKEILLQGLEDRTEVFDYLVNTWRIKNGLSEHTDKAVLLSRLYQDINRKPKTPDVRGKIKEITVRLLDENEKSKMRMRLLHRMRESKLNQKLMEAHKIIREQKRALKAVPTKPGRK